MCICTVHYSVGHFSDYLFFVDYTIFPSSATLPSEQLISLDNLIPFGNGSLNSIYVRAAAYITLVQILYVFYVRAAACIFVQILYEGSFMWLFHNVIAVLHDGPLSYKSNGKFSLILSMFVLCMYVYMFA